MLGLVINPQARAVLREPSLADRLAALLGRGDEVVIPEAPEALAAAVERLRARGCDAVALCGGDGTTMATLTALRTGYGAAALPRVALLRGGTVNTVARNLGVRGRPEQILARLVAGLAGGGPLAERQQDTLIAGGRCGFLFAAAMGARFLQAYYRRPAPGPAAAAVLAARTIGSSLIRGPLARSLFDPVPLSLCADGQPLPLSTARLLCASTIADLGLGMRLAWRAGREPGRFHVIASGLSTPRLALQVPRVLAGRPLRGAPHLDLTATRLEIRFQRPEPYTLDGDLFEDQTILIESGPRLRMISA
jgi:diacylglycerol kinase (ATP)